MTDFLLVHGAGQGAWAWGKVWGYMTAPQTHPPRLYAHTPVGRVYPMDLPGHGADSDGDTSSVVLDECVQAIVRVVERQSLHDVVLVGHEIGGGLVLHAAGQLSTPPKKVVLLGGIVPQAGGAMISEFVMPLRLTISALKYWNGLIGQELRLPGGAVTRYLCNGMDPMEVVQMVGFMGPLPAQVLQAKVPEIPPLPCPVSYVILSGSRVVPPVNQRRMAERLGPSDVLEMDSCHQVVHHRPRELADLLMSFA